MTDAVVIGAGPNGLVAANLLADAGWSVIVLEAEDTAGGAVRSGEVTAPGFVNDLYSAFYPLGRVSPVISRLALERHGLEWCHAPEVLAHPTPGGPTALLSRDIDVTAASLDRFAKGDGDAWRRVFARWERVSEPIVAALLDPFPPVQAALRLGAKVGPANLLDFTRGALLPVRRMAEEEFTGAGGSLLLAGNAMHADFTLDATAGAFFGWLLASLGQQVGFPAPRGGAQRLTDALVARLAAGGGTVRTGARVIHVHVEGGRAVGVELDGGERIAVSKAVIGDCDALKLYRDLVGEAHLPASFIAKLARFQRGPGTFKVDWALSGPIPWSDPAVAPAGTVHLGSSMDELSITATQLAMGMIPADPFLLLGQMTTTDSTRSPAGTESAWAYTHIPVDIRSDAGGDLRRWDRSGCETFADRMEARIERDAPGFRDRIIARYVAGPPDLEARNANLVGGDLGGGTNQLHQQLVFRPATGRAGPHTPIKGLYLGSASAHPGGGVHGACGANAAHAVLAREQLPRRLAAGAALASGVGLLVRRRR